MINEQRIEELLIRLEYLSNIFSFDGSKPTKEWLKDTSWLIYDTRRDMDSKNFDFDGLYTEFDLNEKCEQRCSKCDDYLYK